MERAKPGKRSGHRRAEQLVEVRRGTSSGKLLWFGLCAPFVVDVRCQSMRFRRQLGQAYRLHPTSDHRCICICICHLKHPRAWAPGHSPRGRNIVAPEVNIVKASGIILVWQRVLVVARIPDSFTRCLWGDVGRAGCCLKGGRLISLHQHAASGASWHE